MNKIVRRDTFKKIKKKKKKEIVRRDSAVRTKFKTLLNLE